MTILNRNLILATAIGLVLSGCGGGDTAETAPTEGEVVAPLEDSATDATQAVDNAASEAGNALEQAADSTTAAVDSSADAAMDAGAAGWTDLQANWQDSIGSIKDRWADLSEEELLSVNGDREALVTLVQEKYGLDRDTAEGEVNDWASTL